MNGGVLFPLVVATIAGGVIITVMSGTYDYWVPILLALAVTGLVCRSIR